MRGLISSYLKKAVSVNCDPKEFLLNFVCCVASSFSQTVLYRVLVHVQLHLISTFKLINIARIACRQREHSRISRGSHVAAAVPAEAEALAGNESDGTRIAVPVRRSSAGPMRLRSTLALVVGLPLSGPSCAINLLELPIKLSRLQSSSHYTVCFASSNNLYKSTCLCSRLEEVPPARGRAVDL